MRDLLVFLGKDNELGEGFFLMWMKIVGTSTLVGERERALTKGSEIMDYKES